MEFTLLYASVSMRLNSCGKRYGDSRLGYFIIRTQVGTLANPGVNY